MVIKTQLCSFSDYKIYPGHGQKYLARDGKTYIYLTRKTSMLGRKKVRAQKITWTTAWRRLNRKIKVQDHLKKKKKKIVRNQRAIEGLSLEEINKTKNMTPKEKEAITDQAKREIAERKKKALDKKRTEKKTFQKQKPQKREQKVQKKHKKQKNR